MVAIPQDVRTQPSNGLQELVTFVVFGVVGLMVLSSIGLLPAGTVSVENLTKALTQVLTHQKVAIVLPGLPESLTNPKSPTNKSGASGNSVAQRGMALVASGGVTTITGDCNPLSDLKSGKIFEQDITYLEKLVKAGFKVRLSCIMTGHSPNVAGTDITSLHSLWKGFDVDRINGQPICDVMVGSVGINFDTRHCSQPSAASQKLTHWLFAQSNSQLPFEVGGPFRTGGRGKVSGPLGSRGGPFFTNTGHQKHFHFGFKPTDPMMPNGSWWGGD